MGRIKNIVIAILLVIFFTITSLHSCSNKGRLSTYKAQAGERLLYFFYKENLSVDILKMDNFRYYKINMTLSGKKTKYEDFIIRHGYIKINEFIFCKDENSIKLLEKNQTTVLQYMYEDTFCKNL